MILVTLPIATVAVAEPVHPPLAPVTVYTVVTDGLAITEGPLAVFRLSAGLQVYAVAPEAESARVLPSQIVLPEEGTEKLSTGAGFTDTVTMAGANALLQPVAEAPVTE